MYVVKRVEEERNRESDTKRGGVDDDRVERGRPTPNGWKKRQRRRILFRIFHKPYRNYIYVRIFGT